MIVGVPRESFPGERRVALVPAVIPNLAKAGLEVVLEAGAGVEAGYPDADYVAKSERIIRDRADVFRTADIITQVLCYGSNDRTGKADLPLFHRDQILIGFLRPLGSVETIQDIASKGVTSFSVELMPRTTRAQSMDALSSMGTICGYKAVLITAAVIPGKTAPVLVTKEMVAGMAPGSVIVDLAAERGGNCELTKGGEKISVNGVTIIGWYNLASTVPYHASQMYARNLTAFLLLLVKNGKPQLNTSDEIIRDTLLTQSGEVVNARLREFFQLPALATKGGA